MNAVFRQCWTLETLAPASSTSDWYARAGERAHVEVTGRIDDDLGEDRPAALLALEQHAAHRPVLDERAHDPGVQQQPHALVVEQVRRDELEPLRIDHRRARHGVAERAQALAPVRDELGLGRAPLLGRWAGDRVGGQAIEDLRAEAGDDLVALPIGHAVDPDDQAAGREPAEVVVALDERDLRAEPPRRDRGRTAGGPAADDEHVGLVVHRRLARGLVHGARGLLAALAARRPLGEPAVATGVVAIGVVRHPGPEYP